MIVSQPSLYCLMVAKMTEFELYSHYNIGYAVVSLIFIGNALGFIMAAPFIDTIRARLGRAKTLALSQILMACGYIPMVCTAPFPVVVICFFFIGFGYAVSLAIGNVFCGNLRKCSFIFHYHSLLFPSQRTFTMIGRTLLVEEGHLTRYIF